MSTKILVAEDGAMMRQLLKKLLTDWGYTVTAVEDGLTALHELQKPDAPKLAILDWMMPGLTGPEIIRQIRNGQPDTSLYAILLTAKTDNSDLVFGLDSGADDFLRKPVDAQELQARLRVGQRIIGLQSKLAQAFTVSEFRASHDALTGLYNRRTILTILSHEKALCTGKGVPLGVLLADLDYFKTVNDTYGHPVGDAVLLEAAGRMQSSLRGTDSLGRYGGEEFLVIVPGCGPANLSRVAERLCHAVAKSPMRLETATLNVTVSVGGTMVHGEEETSAALTRADLALYDAKHAGRNTCAFRPLHQDEKQSDLPAEFMSIPRPFPAQPSSALLDPPEDRVQLGNPGKDGPQLHG